MGRDRSQAVVCRMGKLLLVEHFLKGRRFYNLPGGGIEDGETPEEAALRELQEEAGYRCEHLEVLLSLRTTVATGWRKQNLFFLSGNTGGRRCRKGD